jgi:hypothetical protein
MFCPQCGTENKSEQSYCRQCGLTLPAVRLALEGHVDEALIKLKKGSGSLSGGVLIFIVGLLNALVNGYFAAWQSAAFSIILGSIIGVPLAIVGIARISQAKRLLNGQGRSKRLQAMQSDGANNLMTEVPAAHALNPKPPISNSITENTTVKLESSKSVR